MRGRVDWVRAAMTDDTVVVELLLRLKQPQTASVSRNSQSLPGSKLPLSWGVKQTRSKTALAASRWDGAVSRRKDAVVDSVRFSPTTPLSWSGGTSQSATADGYEESSRPHHSARSKAIATGECSSHIVNTKSSKRRKTFALGKDVECSLLEERIYLRKEIDTFHVSRKARRTTNQSLKRMKLDFVQDAPMTASTTSDCRLSSASHSADPTPSSSSHTRQTKSSSFLLPDLNRMPSEDD